MGELIDAKEIAAILGYTTPEAAAHLCRSGRLKTAKKMGNAWCADKDEIEEYKAEQPQGRSKSRKIPDSTRAEAKRLIRTLNLTNLEISRRLGISHVTVAKIRAEISADKGIRIDIVDWQKYDSMLGKVTDAEIAKLAGCNKSTARRRRQKLGIGSFTPRGNPPS